LFYDFKNLKRFNLVVHLRSTKMKSTIKITSLFLCICFLLVGCEKRTANTKVKKITFDQKLADKLAKMTEIDQYYAGIPQGKYEGNWEGWYVVRDSMSRVHKEVLDSVIKIHGYPGYNLVGKSGESDFWVMVQHADFDPGFQAEVLKLLKEQVEQKNADANHIGLLTDRVRKNTNQPQLYGTQVSYNTFGQAYIEALEDSINVNKRRKILGMETLQEYLNGMTENHFRMNKEYLEKEGIKEPKLYPIPEAN